MFEEEAWESAPEKGEAALGPLDSAPTTMVPQTRNGERIVEEARPLFTAIVLPVPTRA